MASSENLYGFYLERQLSDELLSQNPQRPKLEYHIKLGKYDPKRTTISGNSTRIQFFTNRKISSQVKTLLERGFAPEFGGGVGLKISWWAKTIETDPYFPIPMESQYDMKLRRMGFGTLVDLGIEKDLRKIYPDYKYMTPKDSDYKRKRQFRKMGLKAGTPAELEQAYTKTRKAVIKQYRKNKPWNERIHNFLAGLKKRKMA